MQITYDDLRVLYRLLYQQQEALCHLQQEQLRLQQTISQLRQLETAQNGPTSHVAAVED